MTWLEVKKERRRVWRKKLKRACRFCGFGVARVKVYRRVDGKANSMVHIIYFCEKCKKFLYEIYKKFYPGRITS